MKIEVGKEYRTRDGETMLVVYKSKTDRKFMIFLAVNEDDDEVWYTDEGHYYRDGKSSERDLVSPAPKRIKVEGWVNVYGKPFDYDTFFIDKESADRLASVGRIACKRIEFEVEEGEGL